MVARDPLHQVYALTGVGRFASGPANLYRSNDGGVTWTPVNDPNATGDWEGTGGNTWSIAADPTIPGVVWAT